MLSRRFRNMFENRSHFQIATVVIAYWFVSITIVFLNKKLFSAYQIDVPLSITCVQCGLSAIFYRLINCFGSTAILQQTNVFDSFRFKKIIPVAFVFTLMITTNNLCLKYVSVSFYYIGRCLTTIFNVLLTFLVLKKPISIRVLVCCAIIVFGFVLGIDQESVSGTLSPTGLIFGIAGSFLVSLYSIGVKQALQFVQNDSWTLMYFNNCYTLILFLPLIIISGELADIFDNHRTIFNSDFLVPLAISGLFGFFINFLISLQIQLTSPLTNNVSGTAKACVQTVLSTYWFDETKSFVWWLSNLVVLVGSACYTRVRQLEMDRETKSYERLATVNVKQ